jgi:AAA domain-containing protein/DnaB helicase-like protein
VTTVDQRPVPNAAGAERATLSVMMQSITAVRDARSMLTAADFYTPAHAVIFAVCCDLADAGTHVDPVVLLAELTRRGDLGRIGGANYLHQLYALPVTATNVAHYAAQIRDTARRRRLIMIGQRLAQIGEDGTDLDDTLTVAARESLALDLLIDETVDGPVDGLTSWDEFLNQPDRVEDWIVPGLLERQDVVMVLATPGGGKSWLSRQVALCVAAGVHPFHADTRIQPQRTLLIDLENPPQMVRRQSRGLATSLARLGVWDPDLAHIWAQPGGMNIRKHADAQLLERVIAETRPALVTIGSLYNVFERGRDDWDTAAEEAKAVFNRLRGRYRCAFWIEHHMPKGSEHKNPFGSSVWERWPGFGRVIDRKADNVYELAKTFRGDRDIREFPAGLYRGGQLPWSPIWDQDEVDLLVEGGEGRMR